MKWRLRRGGVEDRGGNKQERGAGKQDKRGEVVNLMGEDSPCWDLSISSQTYRMHGLGGLLAEPAKGVSSIARGMLRRQNLQAFR